MPVDSRGMLEVVAAAAVSAAAVWLWKEAAVRCAAAELELAKTAALTAAAKLAERPPSIEELGEANDRAQLMGNKVAALEAQVKSLRAHAAAKEARRAAAAAKEAGEAGARTQGSSGAGGGRAGTGSSAVKPQRPAPADAYEAMASHSRPIGVVKTCFRECRGTPRQGSFAPSTRGKIVFEKRVQPASTEGLESYSHVWIVFLFHRNTNFHVIGAAHADPTRCFRPKVKPPKLKGKSVGVFASRTPHRPIQGCEMR